MWPRRSGREPYASVQEQLPLEEIAGDVLELRSGDARAVLEAGSVNFALKSETEQEAILAGYRRFLNGLDYPLQVLVRVAPADIAGVWPSAKEIWGYEEEDEAAANLWGHGLGLAQYGGSGSWPPPPTSSAPSQGSRAPPRGARRCGGWHGITAPSCGASRASGRCSTAASSSSSRRSGRGAPARARPGRDSRGGAAGPRRRSGVTRTAPGARSPSAAAR